jgi:RNA polymerase sigma-70 factor (ECF subfamily)
MTTLAAAFRARREADEAASGDLEAELRGIVARARAACPSVAISDEHFVAALAERVERAADPMIALRSTHADDLFLAIACAAGDRVALERFEELFVPDLRQSLLRMGLSESAAS